MDQYGIWLFDSWSETQAGLGLSAGRDVYDDIPEKFVKAPKSVKEAYDQAAYWLSIGSRRADHEDEEAAQDSLSSALSQLQTTRDESVGWWCSLTGLACGEQNKAQILRGAIDSIEYSGLNMDDRIIITGYLTKAKNAVVLKAAIPKIAIAAVGVGIIFLVVRRSQRETTQTRRATGSAP